MAIGRSTMTKQMFGNRTKKMSSGGKTTSAALKSSKTPALKCGGKVKK